MWWRLTRAHYATKWPPHCIDRNICWQEHMSSCLSWLNSYIIDVMTLNSRMHFKDCRHNSNYSQRYYKASSYKHGGHQLLALEVEQPPGVGWWWRCVVVGGGFIMTSSDRNIFRVAGPLRGGAKGGGGGGGGGGGWSSGGSPHKGPVMRTFDLPLLLVWTNGWTNARLAGNSKRHDGHLTSP